MDVKAREALERFEHAQHHGAGDDHGHDDEVDPAKSPLIRDAAISVAVLAACLAIATLFATKAMTKVITGETKAADTNAALHANEVKTTIAENDATLFRVIGGDAGERAAAAKAVELEQRLVEHYAPIDAALEKKAHAYAESRDKAESDHKLFEYATAGLEIAIVIASVSIIARRRWLLQGAWGAGVVSVGVLVAGFLN
jgi:hypothetical protein